MLTGTAPPGTLKSDTKYLGIVKANKLRWRFTGMVKTRDKGHDLGDDAAVVIQSTGRIEAGPIAAASGTAPPQATRFRCVAPRHQETAMRQMNRAD